MKDPLNRTKVVIRHLPPSISQSALMEQIDGRFNGRYKWFSFRPGKNSQKNFRYSRAYVDFQSPKDVVEFAEFFDGHIFVNEKGAQFKAIVEYAPSQHIPMVSSKKDGREGTIFKDPEYLEFLEFITKPVENLPSAEIQLERREAERAGGSKEAVIVTPLMDFIRQKRASKSGSQRSSSRRGVGAASSSSSSSKRGSEKRRGSSSVYILRDSEKTSSTGKDKSSYMLVSRKEDKQLMLARRAEVAEAMDANGTIPIASGGEVGKRVVLLKGKEREASNVSGGSSQQLTASVRNFAGSTSSKPSQKHEASGRIVRSILSNKDAHQNRPYLAGTQPEWQTQARNSGRDKRPPRPPNPSIFPKDHAITITTHPSGPDNDGRDGKASVNKLHGSVSVGDKNDRCMRNKDRPDRGVWTPRRSDGVHTSDDFSLSAQQLSDSFDGISLSRQEAGHKDGNDDMGFQSACVGRGRNSVTAFDATSRGERKFDLPSSNRKAEIRSGRSNISSAENGAHRHVGRRGSAYGMKEVDPPLNFSEGKPSTRGVSTGYGSYELLSDCYDILLGHSFSSISNLQRSAASGMTSCLLDSQSMPLSPLFAFSNPASRESNAKSFVPADIYFYLLAL